MSTERAIQSVNSGDELLKLFPDAHLSEAAIKELDAYYALDGVVDRSAIMTCPGENNCPHAIAGECPLANAGDPLPINKPCPIEAIHFKKIYDSLSDGVMSTDPNGVISHSDKLTCRDIATLDIMIKRILKAIGRSSDPTVEITVGVNPQSGEQLTSMTNNPAYTTLGALMKEREAIYRRLQKGIDIRNKLIKNKVEIDEMAERKKDFQRALTNAPLTKSKLQKDIDNALEIQAKEKQDWIDRNS